MPRITLMPLLLVLLSACSPISSTYSSPVPPRCGFARDYTVAELVSQPARQQQFLAQVMQAEAAFFRPNVSYVAATAMTLDGSILNYTSGLPLAMHDFSAPSKESAMLMLMARALNGSHLAQLFFAQDAGSLPAVRAHILTLLQRKLAALETFNATYPGFGGHLPWYTHDLSRTRIVPNPDWADPYRVPALDNGEFYFGLYAVREVLLASEPALARRIDQYMQLMESSAKLIFYAGNGTVRWVATIGNVSLPPSRNTYSGEATPGDPYEGELFTWLLDLKAEWSSNDEREMPWVAKRAMLVAVNYTANYSGNGAANITVQKGFWFSAHEQWKLLMMPYRDVPLAKRVFDNCERARTINSAQYKIPGLYACINDVAKPNSSDIPDYIGKAGIPSIAFQSPDDWRYDVITPYAAFPVSLANLTYGLAWYLNMLQAPRGQGPLGSMEAVNVNGTEMSPVATWDSKSLSPIAFLGGVSDLVRQGLLREKLYPRFIQVVSREMGRVFDPAQTGRPLAGESLDFELPNRVVPLHPLGDYPSCT